MKTTSGVWVQRHNSQIMMFKKKCKERAVESGYNTREAFIKTTFILSSQQSSRALQLPCSICEVPRSCKPSHSPPHSVRQATGAERLRSRCLLPPETPSDERKLTRNRVSCITPPSSDSRAVPVSGEDVQLCQTSRTDCFSDWLASMSICTMSIRYSNSNATSRLE